MSDPVERLYGELAEIARSLRERDEPSLETTLDDIHRKALLLAAASYFEVRLTGDVQAFCDAKVCEGSPVSGLVKSKAISRQYHTWFQWDAKNANAFFGLFGSGFKVFMEGKIKAEDALSESIKIFLALGADRNRLVHQNFGSFALEATPDEIIARYRGARAFVESFGALLKEFDDSLHHEKPEVQ
jgi:hypothetical protein